MLLIGDNPLDMYWLSSAPRSRGPTGRYTLVYATPLIFTGLAVAVAFRCAC